ncbi:hypothetical protein D3C87_1822230 [compost metagenome]
MLDDPQPLRPMRQHERPALVVIVGDKDPIGIEAGIFRQHQHGKGIAGMQQHVDARRPRQHDPVQQPDMGQDAAEDANRSKRCG